MPGSQPLYGHGMESRCVATGVAVVSVLVAGCGSGSDHSTSGNMFKIADRIERSVTNLEPYATAPPPNVLCLPANAADYVCMLRWKAPVPGVTRGRKKHLSLDVVVNDDATKFSAGGANSLAWTRLAP